MHTIYQFRSPDRPTITIDLDQRLITRHICGGLSVELYRDLTALQERMDCLENLYGHPPVRVPLPVGLGQNTVT